MSRHDWTCKKCPRAAGGRLKYRVAESERRWRAFKEKAGTFQARWQTGRKETCEKKLQGPSSSKEGGVQAPGNFSQSCPVGELPAWQEWPRVTSMPSPWPQQPQETCSWWGPVDGITDAPCGQRVEPHVAVAPSALTDQCGVRRVIQQGAGPRSQRSWWPGTGFWIQCLLLTLTYPTAFVCSVTHLSLSDNESESCPKVGECESLHSVWRLGPALPERCSQGWALRGC